MKLTHMLLSIAACSLLYPESAMAWGSEGHQKVGAIADRMLTDKARSEVSAILGIPLETASVWADCAKGVSVKNGVAVYNDNPIYAECDALDASDSEFLAAMKNYVLNNWSNCDQSQNNEACHKQHHYADISIHRSRYDASYVGASDQDIVTTINAALAVLTDRPQQTSIVISSKREALLLLAHLIGDLHQPLHIGSVYLDNKGREVDPDNNPAFLHDYEVRGGNDLKSDGQNLHSMWDSLSPIGDLDSLVKLAVKTHRTDAQLTELAASWASLTLPLSKRAYKGLRFKPLDSQAKQYDVKFSNKKSYLKSKIDIQRMQVALAGAHLAEFLNRVWE